MQFSQRWVSWLVLLASAFALGACSIQHYRDKSSDLILAGHYEEANKVMQDAVADHPESGELKGALLQNRQKSLDQLVANAQMAQAQGNFDEAATYLQRAEAFDPQTGRVMALEHDLAVAKRQGAALKLAQEAAEKHRYPAALDIVNDALKENAHNAPLLALQQQLQASQRAAQRAAGRAGLGDGKPISLDFRDASLRSVLDVMAHFSGINFILDKDIRPDTHVSVYLKNARFEDALDLITSSNQLAKKVLDEKTVVIYPNTPDKQRENQEQVVRVFYLASGDAKGAAALIKSMLKVKDPYVDERRNMLSLRDSPENIELAARLISLYDQPDAEVLLEAEVIEVSATRLTQLGITYPSSVTLSPLTPGGASQLTLGNIGSMGKSDIGVSLPNLLISLKRQVGDVNILASPRIRARSGEKGKIMIGDKVPVITTTTGSNGFASESVNYQDVGLSLNVEPTVYADDDVAIKVEMEVSTLGQQVTTSSGSVAYQISTRNASTLLRLRDGETQLLGGLISNQDSSSSDRVPGLGDLPMLGRLFRNQTDNGTKTELVLAITPHILRNIRRPDAAESELWVGTEANQRPRAYGGRVMPADDATPPAPAKPGPSTTPAAGAPDPAQVPAAAAVAPVFTWQVPASVKAGEEFQATLMLENKTPVRGVPLRIVLPKDKVAFVDVSEGDYFKIGGTKTAFTNKYDKDQSVLSIGVLRMPADGVTGKGGVVTLRLKALAAGPAEVSMVGAEPVGSDGPIAPVTTPATFKLDVQS
ncbi:secretin N-terminal domain-containing protein [Amantichitinum ursilacus]|nr:secretin N-terminal domain-containing protein [Amantichitinum ursilacus]